MSNETNRIQRFFKLSHYNTNIKTEVTAGITTFLTMAYIIFVNPQILHQAGMPYNAVFIATCITAMVGCLLVGLIANFPVGIAPSMGLNVYFTYVIVLKMGYTWESALGAVFLAGVIFYFLTVFKVRQWILDAIPPSLSIATAAGIGLFIGLIALKNAGVVVGNHDTLVELGKVGSAPVLLCFLGFFLIAALDHFKIPGSIIISILAVSIIALVLGKTHYHGIISIPPSIEPTAFKFNIESLFHRGGLMIIFTFVLVALFDSSGTLLGLAHEAKIPTNNPDAKQRISRTLMADSLATITGSLLGTSTTATYVESATGIRAGGRTGLTSVVIACGFGLSIFFAPLTKMIPIYASAPALLFIAAMMLRHMNDIEWDDLTEAIPSAITMIMIPFTFSIANGIGLGFISYVCIKLLTGKIKEIRLPLVLISALFLLFFLLQ